MTIQEILALLAQEASYLPPTDMRENMSENESEILAVSRALGFMQGLDEVEKKDQKIYVFSPSENGQKFCYSWTGSRAAKFPVVPAARQGVHHQGVYEDSPEVERAKHIEYLFGKGPERVQVSTAMLRGLADLSVATVPSGKPAVAFYQDGTGLWARAVGAVQGSPSGKKKPLVATPKSELFYIGTTTTKGTVNPIIQAAYILEALADASEVVALSLADFGKSGLVIRREDGREYIMARWDNEAPPMVVA